MRTLLAMAVCATVLAVSQPAQAQRRGALGPEITNPRNQFLVWGDYKVEVNQYGGLGRDWPWQFKDEQYALLKAKAEANPEPPNILRAILLICPTVEATAVKRENGRETVVGTRTSRMSSREIMWAIEQWREQAEFVYVFSGGNAAMITDIKIVPEPLKVKTNEEWGHFSGPKHELLEKYLPFQRGEYDSYNSVYSNRDLNGGPWGGTLGAIVGVKGVATSDNLWIGRGEPLDAQHAWVFWHEFLNQCCSSTSHILPYPPNEELWNMYCWEWTGHRTDPIPLWPGWTNHRDMMRMVIRPTMWRRWRITAPYRSPAVGQWILFGPTAEPRDVRALCTAPAEDGRYLDADLGTYDHFNVGDMLVGPDFPAKPGTYYLRTFVESPQAQDVQILAGGDEDFEIWLNGRKIRDGYGWKYSKDDGKLFEKVTYATLAEGANTLVFVLPNTDRVAEFRLRFGRSDGSGEQPEGVEAWAKLPDGEQPLPLLEPLVWDFANPQFFKWADVGDDPWLSMPRLSEQDLATLTGIPSLKVRTDGAVRKNAEGQDYIPCQHLFLDVPREAVTSPWIAEPTEDNAALNNDFDFNWKSVAWLRVPGRPGNDKDVLLVRNDVAEPIMHLLKTRGRPGQESIVGWMVIERKLVYVLLVDLDITEAPETELGLLTQQPE